MNQRKLSNKNVEPESDSDSSEYSELEEEDDTESDNSNSDEDFSDSGNFSNVARKQSAGKNIVKSQKKVGKGVKTVNADETISDNEDFSDSGNFNKAARKKSAGQKILKSQKKVGKGVKTVNADETISDNEESSEPFDSDTESALDVSSKSEVDLETQTVPIVDEYEHDTSDEEDIRNTVGNIPMKWYDDFAHIGYDVDGMKIMKPASTDEIDEFLRKIDDPNYWRTVTNKMTGEKIVLTDEDLDIIQRIQSGRYPTGEVQYEPFEDFFTYETMEHPVTNHPPHKRSFIPSKIEKEKVSKLVYAIKMGWIKPRVPKEKKDDFYMLWEKDVAEESKRLQHYIPAPKRKLPGHEESYNPPPEYLFTRDEEDKWKKDEPEMRKLDFIPQKYSTLRQVPAYSQFIKEWFERCLDLYLCPRQRKMRVNVDPNDLIPQLPKPKDLQPFPTTLAVVFSGHDSLVRCITVEPSGQFMASGSDDETVKIWEVLSGRCLRTIPVGGPVKGIAWCPSEALCLLLVVVGGKVLVINTKCGDKVVISNTDSVLSTVPENPDDKVVQWAVASEEEQALGIRLVIVHSKDVKQVVWHAKGDYFAALTAEPGRKAVVIHQLSKFRSQIPFQKLKGNIQCILFHPLRPFFFVATQKHVKVFNLLKQEASKVLFGNCKWISSMAAHPQGDNLILGSYDSKLSWFDLELSTKPYKTLRHHTKAIRQVSFHKRYPLFASTSDDGSVIICHGMVYSDLLQNPMIVPVKVLKGQGISLDCCFHPQRPWIFCSSTNTIRLFS